jgi:osmotically-inducible protein OsmY
MMNKPVLTLALTAALVATLGATTGCAVTRDQETVGAYIDDAALTTRVKSKFAADTTVSAMAISVETLKGTVQLSGFAKSAEERAMAEKLARETSGVVAVRNDISVRN